MRCLKDRCRSPVACGGFGYCRERNQDGRSMDEETIMRRRAEEAEAFADTYHRARKLMNPRSIAEATARNSFDSGLYRADGETDEEFVLRICATYLAVELRGNT